MSPTGINESPNSVCATKFESVVPMSVYANGGNSLARAESISSANGLMKYDDMEYDEYVSR